MQKLIAELARLYLPQDTSPPAALADHLKGQASIAISLLNRQGLTRTMLIPFAKMTGGEAGQHWNRLCELAHILQNEFGFPAPAVSISGASSYALWLSLKTPVAVVQVQKFLTLLQQAYFPDIDFHAEAAGAAVYLPPCLHLGSGKWAAFIHPGLGASFADDSGLEMAPPPAAQLAFLAHLQSIDDAQFAHALTTLEQLQGTLPAAVLGPGQEPAPITNAPPAKAEAAADSLLLRDATLEDIVQFLHSKNIEPTFRHLLPA